MRSDVARSIALVMLMIVSVQMPMFDNAEEPVELKEEPLIEMVAQNPCQGYDACLGYDVRLQRQESGLPRRYRHLRGCKPYLLRGLRLRVDYHHFLRLHGWIRIRIKRA